MKVGIVFLGRRGGGRKLFEIIGAHLNDLRDIDPTFVMSEFVGREFRNSNFNYISVPTPKSPWSLLITPFLFLKQFRLFRRLIRDNNFDYFLFVMPAPSDFLLIKLLKIEKIKIVSIIHEVIPHLGENWPTKRVLSRRIQNSDVLITLSYSIQEQLKDDFNRDAIVLNHPIFSFGHDDAKDQLIDISDYILFIGRIRKYKGLDILLNAMNDIKYPIPTVIAGEGEINFPLPNKTYVINRWLEDNEIHQLLSKASIVVFPYRDASQSGFIPTCIAMNKVIVVSDSGALVEQSKLAKQDLVYVFPAANPSALAEVINRAIKENQDRTSGARSRANSGDYQIISGQSGLNFTIQLFSGIRQAIDEFNV